MSVICQRCGKHNGIRTNRFCKPCKKQVLFEMKASGYLQNTYVAPYFSEERGRKGMRDMRVVGGEPY